MAEYNEPGGSFDRRKEVGEDCTLEFPQGNPIPVTNVSFSEEAETSEVQYTNGWHQNIAVTGVSYSGSFEIAGNANEERNDAWEEQGNTAIPSHVSNMSINDGTDTWTFTNVVVESHEKDIPADDRVTHSFDFMAEKLITE